MFSRPKTVARSPAPPVTVAKTAARVASAAATDTANARTPADAKAANILANKAAAVARVAANKAAANARAAAAAAKKTSNNQAAAKKAANTQAAAAAAKKAANQAANSAAKSNTVALGRGIRMSNVTNKVKSLAARATALGGSAYATYVNSGNAQALTIAATCMVLLYIAYALLGRTPKTKVSVLEAQIKKANSNLTRRITTHPRHAVYKAYMRKGNVNAANRVLNGIRANFAPNVARIAGMRSQLDGLLNEVVQALPLTVPNRNVTSVIESAIPFAERLLTAYTQVTVLEIKRKNATTAYMIAATNAETARANAVVKQAELQVQQSVGPFVAKVRGMLGAGANVATTATAVGTALAPVVQRLVSVGRAAAPLWHRRRGGA